MRVLETLSPWPALTLLNNNTKSIRTSTKGSALMSSSSSNSWRKIRLVESSYSLPILIFILKICTSQLALLFPQVKVMHKQLLLFHNAISAYFAGNQQQLEQTLRQFNIKLRPPGADKPSWLEEQ